VFLTLFALCTTALTDGSTTDYWLKTGQESSQKGYQSYNEALQACNKIIDTDPKNVEAWMLKRWVLYHLDRYENAISSFNKALEYNSRLTRAISGKAESLTVLCRSEEALAEYN
jgi:tetratricopeptide (TPR) repeat protein